MNRRGHVLLSFVAVLALITAACGSTAESSTSTETETTATTAQPAEEVAETTEPRALEPSDEEGVCNREFFAGTWISVSPSDRELRAIEENGDEDISLGIVVLELNDDAPSVQTGDTTELFEEWICGDSYIFGVDANGSEQIIAALVDGGRLNYFGRNLTKSDDASS